MEFIKAIKIPLVYLQPGDTIHLNYVYEESKDVWTTKTIEVDSTDKAELIDTVLVYKIDGEYGMKSGRAIMLGEDDGTYKDLPLTIGSNMFGGRTTTLAVK